MFRQPALLLSSGKGKWSDLVDALDTAILRHLADTSAGEFRNVVIN
jgi:hypothetical protein